jgi:hypothetical protein
MEQRLQSPPTSGARPRPRGDDERTFAIVLCGTLLLVPAALALGWITRTPPAASLAWSIRDLAIGLFGAAPLALLLHAFMRAKHSRIVAFREQQLEFFGQLGFRFTTSRIVLLALAAGVAEELLFRGFLQSWLATLVPLSLAIVLPNLLFGALHARTLGYALAAGVVGVWLGVLYALTDNLLAPIVAHAAYDAIALDVTRRALAGRSTPST